MDQEQRLRNLFSKLEEKGLAAFLVSHPPDLYYLFSFSGSTGWALLWEGEAHLFVDSRYTSQAREEARSCRVVQTGDPLTNLEETLPAGTRIGVEGDRLSYSQAQEIMSRLAQCSVSPVDGLLSELRMRKSRAETARIRAACQTALTAYNRFREEGDRRGTEIEAAALLDFICRQLGASRSAFDTIVAGGARTALPHASPGHRRIDPSQLLLVDFGIVKAGYCSDLTRCTLPAPTGEAAEVYRIVREAQEAAISSVIPGTSTLDVDAAARRVISQAGYGEFFVHGTGHGIGIEVHELPRISFREERELQPGMVFTIEPGIYLPGKFGVRLEEVVAVTDRGVEILSRP